MGDITLLVDELFWLVGYLIWMFLAGTTLMCILVGIGYKSKWLLVVQIICKFWLGYLDAWLLYYVK